MMKQALAILASLVTLTMCLSGCEILEEGDAYITVNIIAYAQVVLIDEEGNDIRLVPYTPVHFDMIKAGGERLQFDDPNEAGQTGHVYGSFHLYKEQDIEIIATPDLQAKLLEQVYPSYTQLNWAEIYPATDFGGTYSWEALLVIEVRNTSTGGGI